MNLDAAIAAETEAHRAVVAVAKVELGALLAGIFAQPGVRDVAWGQKHSDYDDEGMYGGIMGPAINQFSDEDGNIELDDWWDALYNERFDGFVPEANRLSGLLNTIGPEVLCEIVGDDEHVVVAYEEDGVIKFFAESVGY